MRKALTNWRLLDALWLLMLAAYVLAGVSLVPLHGDEPTQIYMARDYYTWFVEGHPDQLGYQAWETLDGDAATRQDLRLKDGTIARLLYGFAAYLNGFGPEDLNNQWAWGSGWEWNHANGHVPSDALLNSARTASSLALIGSIAALFAIGYQLGGRLTAYIGSAFYALNPAILLNGRRAMMESTMLFFGLLVLLIAIYLLKHKTWWQYALLGLFSGLAVASKHTAAVIVVAVFAACGLYYLYQMRLAKERPQYMRHFGVLFGAGLLSLAVFVVFNPAWWSDPLARANDVLTTRSDFISSQLATFGGYNGLTEQATGFVRQTLGVPPMYAETGLDGFIVNQQAEIKAYEASGVAGISIGSTVIGSALLASTSLAGFVALFWYEKADGHTRWLIGVWAVAMLLLALLTPLEWQRYYIPAYPVTSLLTAFGLTSVLTHLYSYRTASK